MKPFVFSFAGLLVIIALTYGTLRYLRSEKDKALAEQEAEKNKSKTENVQKEIAKEKEIPKENETPKEELKPENKKPLSEADSLKMIVELYKQEITGKESIVDSLQSVVQENNRIVKKQQNETQKIDKEEEISEKARAMAKTFEKMSIKQIAPILQNLDDNTVFMIYKETSNRFKKNILLAVNEKRAAQITKEFIHKN